MKNLDLIKQEYGNFIDSCHIQGKGFKLTTKSEISPYALCFAIFGKYLIGDHFFLDKHKEQFNESLRKNLIQKRLECIDKLSTSKPYLQLFTFTLSALKILKCLNTDPLRELTLEIIENKPINLLHNAGVFDGFPGTGNLAMFYGVLLIHANENLNLNLNVEIDSWVNSHLSSMNENGFWGDAKSKFYLQFQNGYHQYEILDYLGVSIGINPAKLIIKLADQDGLYAPYRGGGGCYDYDAVYMLTRSGENNNRLLLKTMDSLLNFRIIDNGFSESHFIRPRNLTNISSMISHIAKSNHATFYERARFGFTLLRPKYNKISTHWSNYSREWNESNLWDSWFRMLTISRIRIYNNYDSEENWGFINFPGIGHFKK